MLVVLTIPYIRQIAEPTMLSALQKILTELGRNAHSRRRQRSFVMKHYLSGFHYWIFDA